MVTISQFFLEFPTFGMFRNIPIFSLIKQSALGESKGLIGKFMYTNELAVVIEGNYLHEGFADCLATSFRATSVAKLLCCFGN